MKKLITVKNFDKAVWDSKYPNFKPAKYITIMTSGYLNGGGGIKAGMIMKLIGVDLDFSGGYDYQGFYNQSMAQYGNNDIEQLNIRHKAISSTEQYIRIEGSWFRASTQDEITQFEKWLADVREANKTSV